MNFYTANFHGFFKGVLKLLFSVNLRILETALKLGLRLHNTVSSLIDSLLSHVYLSSECLNSLLFFSVFFLKLLILLDNNFVFFFGNPFVLDNQIKLLYLCLDLRLFQIQALDGDFQFFNQILFNKYLFSFLNNLLIQIFFYLRLFAEQFFLLLDLVYCILQLLDFFSNFLVFVFQLLALLCLWLYNRLIFFLHEILSIKLVVRELLYNCIDVVVGLLQFHKRFCEIVKLLKLSQLTAEPIKNA